MTKRREFVTSATIVADPGEADALWTALQEQGLEVNPTNVRNVALGRGWPPSKAEDLARAIQSSQQLAEPEAEPEPEPKAKAGNGRRKKKTESEPEPEVSEESDPEGEK